MMKKIKITLKEIFNSIFPHVCVLCSQKTNREMDLCQSCENDLDHIENPCEVCGRHLPQETTICGQCLKEKPYFDQTTAPLSYEMPTTKFITGLKFQHRLINAKILGTLLSKQLSCSEKPEVIIPVPLHKKRLRKRGFNQAVEIAKVVSKKLNIPIDRFNCGRIRNTEPQTLIKAKFRRRNVRNAFRVNPDFKATHVAIVDDVLTTGNTVNELARALKKSGVKKVSVWSAARTSEH